MELRLHSRHIPREHLDFSQPTAGGVDRNGLCDVIKPEELERMRQHGIQVIETRLVWYELEGPDAPGWSALEARLYAIEKAGLTPGLFCWFQHPPKDKKDLVRLRCLEHNEESSIVSMWEPQLEGIYDRLYGELARRYGKRIGFLYVGVFGDFGEVCYPSGVKHYKFSPKHGHQGFWSGDRYAREDYKNYLQKKYNSINKLNESWGTAIADWDSDLMPSMPFAGNSLARRIDYMNWYTESLAKWCDKVCAITEKWFPDIPKGLPMGFVDEALQIGQIKSVAAKIAAAHGITARWTGMAVLEEFSRSDVPAKRISCPALYYGTTYGTEAALTLEAENAGNAAYESIANMSSLIHNDPTNIYRGGQLWDYMIQNLRLSKPLQETGVFYPVEGEMLELLDAGSAENCSLSIGEDLGSGGDDAPPIGVFVHRCASLRHGMDYALFDSTMVRDGYLNKLKRVLFLISAPIPKAVCAELEAFAADGGKLEALEGIRLTVLETGMEWSPDSLRHCSHIEPDAAFKALTEKYDPEGKRFFTIHEDFISIYDPECAAVGDCDGVLSYIER